MLDVRKIRLTLELRQSGISNSKVISAIEKIQREIPSQVEFDEKTGTFITKKAKTIV